VGDGGVSRNVRGWGRSGWEAWEPSPWGQRACSSLFSCLGPPPEIMCMPMRMQARSHVDRNWYNFNDTCVRREASKPSGPSSSAYILFYRLQQLSEP
jgi:hypothetical protein